MNIYLAGKVAKGDEIGTIPEWRQKYIEVLRYIPNVNFLLPDDPQLDESNPFLVFGHDCYLIKNSDIVIVDASSRLGVGTAQEILIAKKFKKLVICVLPKNTHHRRSKLVMQTGIVSEWIHPFIFSATDIIVEDISAAANWVIDYAISDHEIPIKDLGIIDTAISEYENSYK